MRRQQELSEGHKIVLFIGYTAGIYACFLVGAVFEERIYKLPYISNGPDHEEEIFTDKLTPMMIGSGISCLLGFLTAKNEELTFNIPIVKLLKVALSDVIIHVLLIAALLRTSFTTLIVVNTCSIISVIMVGAFCSGVKDNHQDEGQPDIAQGEQSSSRGKQSNKIGADKLIMSAIVCSGIIIFSVSNAPEKKEATVQASGGVIITILLYGVALLLQGFRPDFVTQIKHEYHPSPLFLYFCVQGLVFAITLVLDVATWNISYFISFVLNHNGLLFDIAMWASLHAVGGIFCYKLMGIFRQHILPLVIITRKCFTVLINVLWYGHHLKILQWVGISLVFGGIMVEIVNNYNLASKILPNKNIRNREGQHYNKIIPKDEQINVGYHPCDQTIGDQVEGI